MCISNHVNTYVHNCVYVITYVYLIRNTYVYPLTHPHRHICIHPQCVPQAGYPFMRGSYRCLCRLGFDYWHMDGKFWFEGSLMEFEYEKKRNHLFSRYVMSTELWHYFNKSTHFSIFYYECYNLCFVQMSHNLWT